MELASFASEISRLSDDNQKVLRQLQGVQRDIVKQESSLAALQLHETGLQDQLQDIERQSEDATRSFTARRTLQLATPPGTDFAVSASSRSKYTIMDTGSSRELQDDIKISRTPDSFMAATSSTTTQETRSQQQQPSEMVKHGVIHPDLACVIFLDGTWTAISCNECGANTRRVNKEYFNGAIGLQYHYMRAHKQPANLKTVTIPDTLSICTRRIFDDADVVKMRNGQQPAIPIEKRITGGIRRSNKEKAASHDEIAGAGFDGFAIPRRSMSGAKSLMADLDGSGANHDIAEPGSDNEPVTPSRAIMRARPSMAQRGLALPVARPSAESKKRPTVYEEWQTLQAEAQSGLSPLKRRKCTVKKPSRSVACSESEYEDDI